MPETRRDIFKTSILSAISGLIAGAVGGYAVVREAEATGKGGVRPRPMISGLLGTIVAVYNQSGPWYFFQFGGSYPLSCGAYVAPSSVSAPAPISSPGTSSVVVDTPSWFLSITGQLTLLRSVSNQTVSYNSMAGTGTGTITVTTDGSGNLKPASLNSLLEALADLNQIPGSWNEIGHN